jgi:hypothetical protein
VATNNYYFYFVHVFSGRAPSKGSNNRDVSRATCTWTMEMGMMAILRAIKTNTRSLERLVKHVNIYTFIHTFFHTYITYNTCILSCNTCIFLSWFTSSSRIKFCFLVEPLRFGSKLSSFTLLDFRFRVLQKEKILSKSLIRNRIQFYFQ